MKKLVIILALVVGMSVGLNAEKLSDDKFNELVDDCIDNHNKDSCQRLIDNGLASVKQCDTSTCYVVGFVYFQAGNYQQAFQYVSKACNQFNEYICFIVGLLYYDGKGVRQDFIKARTYYEKACKTNHAGACNNLGFLYGNGKGVKQNLSVAKKYYGKACDLGEQMGCDNYKILNEQGIQ